MWQIQEIAVNTFENLRGKVIYGLPVLLVNPHCGYAFPIASHLLLPAPVSLTVNPFLVRLVI